MKKDLNDMINDLFEIMEKQKERISDLEQEISIKDLQKDSLLNNRFVEWAKNELAANIMWEVGYDVSVTYKAPYETHYTEYSDWLNIKLKRNREQIPDNLTYDEVYSLIENSEYAKQRYEEEKEDAYQRYINSNEAEDED